MKYSGPYDDPLEELEPGHRRITSGTRLHIAQPPDPPSEALLNCVREISRRAVGVCAAYAFEMAVGENSPSLSIGLYFDAKPAPQEVEELFGNLGRRIKPFLEENNFVDLLPLHANNVLGVTVREQIAPFYRRLVQ
jgi:SseB protein C-terminal domain